jgi:Domain of unknown function (DUF1788).
MPTRLTARLNEILPRITSPNFLSGDGIGNEIPFYIFDYPAEHELMIRERLHSILKALSVKKPSLKFEHVNLFHCLLSYIKERGYFDKMLGKEKQLKERFASDPAEADGKIVRSIQAIAGADELAEFFAKTVLSKKPGLILVSGIGSVYPVIRTHEFLNNLHKYMGQAPLILFYPGVYDKTTLKLFGKSSIGFDSSSSDRQRKAKYYRAFRLID